MSSRLLPGLAGLLCILGLIGLAVFLPPDGRERTDFLQFIGSLHPLAVHLPIALLLLMPVLEVAGSNPRRGELRSAAGFVLGIAALSAIATPWLGWLLAWSGGFQGAFVTQHMWGGIFVAAATLLCWILRCQAKERVGTLPKPYVGMLAISVLVVAFTGYRGGQLAHGENHFIEHLRPTLQAWSGRANSNDQASAQSSEVSFYSARIVPIFEEHCLNCHSANKHKGSLRLDSYAQLIRGGKHGPVIKARAATASELFRRVSLDPEHKDFMPAEGKPPLRDEERKLLELWINAGASATMPVNAIAGAPQVAKPVAPLAPDYRPDHTMIASLASALNVRLLPRSQNPTDGLVLRTASAPASFDDAALAKLAPVARYIVDAELARTKVTDAAAGTLTMFTHLRWLDLSHTAITSIGARELIKLPNLRTLNLTGTAVDDAAVLALRGNKTLGHVYVFQTKTTGSEST